MLEAEIALITDSCRFSLAMMTIAKYECDSMNTHMQFHKRTHAGHAWEIAERLDSSFDFTNYEPLIQDNWKGKTGKGHQQWNANKYLPCRVQVTYHKWL